MTSPLPPGRIAMALDAIATVAAAGAVLLAITGPYREALAGTPVSIGWLHAAFAAVGVAAIRHAAMPGPTWFSSVRHWCVLLDRHAAVKDALVVTALLRLPIVLVGLLATSAIGIPADAVEATPMRDPVRALPARWDAQWYAGLAAHGYEWQHSFDPQQNLAFFPAYPALIRALGVVTGAFAIGLPDDKQIARLTWCGLVIAVAAFFGGACYFGALARELMDDHRARAALWLLAAYPFALFYSAAYTESLFLLAALGTWFHFRRDQSAATIGWGLLAGLTRPNGCFLSIPLGLLALGIRDAGASHSRALSWRRLALATTPGIGMLLFTAYVHQMTGIWFAWARTHAAWGRVVGGDAAFSAFSEFGVGGLASFAAAHPYDLMNGLGLLFALGWLVKVWRLSPAWAVFVVIGVGVPLSAGGLLSMGRLTSTLFPLFLVVALTLPAGVVAGLTTSFALMQGLLAALFYTWRAVY